jgi:tetratricopeptide (TPR) repeat protein
MDLSKHLEKAEEAVKRKNYAFAVNLYGQLLALQPDNGQARAGLRTALFKKAEQRKPSKLVAILGGGLSLLTAKIATTFRGHAAAAKSYERYLALDPLNEGANLALARALEKAGFTKSALAVFRAFAEQQPRCLEAAREAGRLLYEQGKLDDALAMYEQALKIDPRDQDALRARKNLAAEGALSKSGIATAQSSRELVKDKEATKKLERAQRLHLSVEEIEAELDEVEKRLATAPNDVDALVRGAELQEMRRDPRAALDFLEQAQSVRPDDAALATKVADQRIKLQERNVEDALARGDEVAAANARKVLAALKASEYRRRVTANPSDLGLRFELGAALYESGDLEPAIAELQQAVKDPRRATEAMLTLGRAFRQKGMADLARGQFEKALAAGGGPSGRIGKEVLYELGTLAEETGDREAAKTHFASILELEWGYRDAADRVAKLQSS